MYNATAPGSMMLMGEHAVLHGSSAIVAALGQNLTVSLEPREDDLIGIESDRLGTYQTSLSDFTIQKPFQFVLQAVAQFLNKLSSGFNLKIISECSDKMGFGTSAAVTVVTLHALSQWVEGGYPDKIELFKLARSVIQAVQGRGSGADVAASVFGGIVAYKPDPLNIQQLYLKTLPEITLVYTGSKCPTPEVIRIVQEKADVAPKKYTTLYQEMSDITDQGILAIQENNIQQFGQLMNDYQIKMLELGVSTTLIDELICVLQASVGVKGAKISGSGLGDCVYGLGHTDLTLTKAQVTKGVQVLPVSIAEYGVR